MKKKLWLIVTAAAILLSLSACGPKPVDYDLSLVVIFDGQAVPYADVIVDGFIEGKTDANGTFVKTLSKLPGIPIRVEARMVGGKVRAKAWETTFSIKPSKEGQPREIQSFAATLQGYVVVAVTYEGTPVVGAHVSVAGTEAGETGADGMLQLVFEKWPKFGVNLSAKRVGLGESVIVFKGDSGSRADIAFYSEAVLKIEALEEHNGVAKPIKDAVVFVDNREVGKTAADGIYTYHQKDRLGNKVPVRISAPGHVPATFTQQIKLVGIQNLRQYFYAASARQPRAAVVAFSANTRGEDIGDVIKVVEPRFVEELFNAKAFKQVPGATAKSLIQRSKLNHAKLKTTGWRGTPLAEVADVLVFGSVSRGEADSFIVEASFYEPDGKLAMTQAVVLNSTGSWRVGRAMSELVSNALANYPFPGVVTGVTEENIQVNLGSSLFELDRDDEFVVKSAKRDADGHISGFTNGGTYQVHRVGDTQSELRPKLSTTPPKLGDHVARLNSSVPSKAGGTDPVTFTVSSDKGNAGEGLAGANLYVDERWAGSTDNKGEVSIQLRLGHKFKLIVYHHGFEQAIKTIEPTKKGEHFQFALKSYSSDLTIESDPTGAVVSIDDARIGTTPITRAIPVPLGFHTLRVDAGNGYRAWEEVVEFYKVEENRTGDHRVTLYKDYLKAAERAEDAHQIEEAIRLYSLATREHPDYAEIHHRLGQLYLDNKHDVDHAIIEFERVQEIPEVQELVLKQYAIVYANLGKAYYTKGESLVKTKRNEAMEYFAKAIKALDRARENTRFFPNERHDEAVHDTYYYRALSYHNLYQISGRESLRANLELAWNEYVDFFPEKLRGNPDFERLRESGLNLSKQLEGQ